MQDKVGAIGETVFKCISMAYEVLGDKHKRETFRIHFRFKSAIKLVGHTTSTQTRILSTATNIVWYKYCVYCLQAQGGRGHDCPSYQEFLLQNPNVECLRKECLRGIDFLGDHTLVQAARIVLSCEQRRPSKRDMQDAKRNLDAAECEWKVLQELKQVRAQKYHYHHTSPLIYKPDECWILDSRNRWGPKSRSNGRVTNTLYTSRR